VLFDPEPIGVLLQRTARLAGRNVDDFQDLWLWRRLTIVALRLARLVYPVVVVPMAFSNLSYLDEIRAGIRRYEPDVRHFCLTAPLEIVRDRLSQRQTTAADAEWQSRRAEECCAVHSRPEFTRHVDAARSVEAVVQELLASIASR
jgi:hypothetical protein